MANNKGTKENKNYKKVAENRRARFDYFIEDTMEAGIMLKGTEIKPLRVGKVIINEVFAEVREGELFLVNAHIDEHGNSNVKWQHEPKRPRKLLLKRKEMGKLIGAIQRQGVTVVPLAMYFNHKGIAKVVLGVAKGKKQHDKREVEKKRDWDREKSRIMRGEKFS